MISGTKTQRFNQSMSSGHDYQKGYILKAALRNNWHDSDIISCISVLAFGTKVRGFKPGRSRRIFKGK